jgi:hypothetical protein
MDAGEAMLEVRAEGRSAQAERGTVPLPKALRWFWAASAVAAALTPVVAWLEWRAGMTKEYWDPLQYPMFWDLLGYVPTFRLLHASSFFGGPGVNAFAYPPFAAVMFALLYATGHPVVWYLLIAIAGLGYAVWKVRGALLREGIRESTALLFPLTMVLFSYPIWRLVPQANVELFLWIFAAAGVVAFLRGREHAAAVLWGLAAATKLYPIILLLLFVPRRRVEAFLTGMATFGCATLLSMMWMGPTVAEAWHGSVRNVLGYSGMRAGQWTMNTTATNHSLFTLVKFAAVVFEHAAAAQTWPYYAVFGVIFVALFFTRLKKMPVTNQVMAASLMMVMLPTVSYFHTLVHLYAPWVMLVLLAVQAERRGVRVPGLTSVMVLMTPLFMSFTLYTFRKVFLLGGMVQAVLLCFLLLYALQYRFELPQERMQGRSG